MKRIIVLSILPAVLAPALSCGSAMRVDDPNTYPPTAEMRFEHKKEICFEEAVKSLEELKCKIETKTQESGEITSDRCVFNEEIYKTFDGSYTKTEHSLKYYLTVKGDTGSCNIRINKLRYYIGTGEQKEYFTHFFNFRAKVFFDVLSTRLSDRKK